MGKIKESKGLYVALSILLAIIFWLYVRAEKDIPSTNTVRNIEIQLVNEDILEARGLMVSEIEPKTLNITFDGSTSVVPKLNRNNVTVSVDVSRITSAGVHDVSYTVNIPTSLYVTGTGVTHSSDTTSVSVTVVPLYSREITIEGTFAGEVAEGYQAGQLEITPETVVVRGEETAVNQVARAVVEIGGETLTETFEGELPIVLLDSKGQVIENSQLRLSVDTALVRLPVEVVKEVPLTVELIPGGGVTDVNTQVKVEISPETILIAGEAEDVNPTTEISLGSIDLSTVLNSQTIEMPIELTNELSNTSGVTKATVTITIEGLDVRTITVDEIEPANVSEGYRATVVTQSIDIQIRGPKESLDQISPSQIRVVADLTDIVSATGRYTVPAKVYLDATNDVGVVGTYTVVVQVSRK